MISVIVPIYNVEPYLRQCIDSIVSQTYTNLEILLIDDGSTDGSGKIADSYDDPRIRVFHTENCGLSAARNLGLDNAHGEYISFVDADDWIDEDLLDLAFHYISDADIVCYSNNNQFFLDNVYIGGKIILQAFINDLIPGSAWCMLCKKQCFSDIRFPTGRIHEDTATTYKLFYHSSKVICLSKVGYHYRSRKGSITHTINIQNLVDFWTAHKERFDYCKNLVDYTSKIQLLRFCAFAITRAWILKNTCSKSIPPEFNEMSLFAKTQFPYNIRKSFSIKLRIGLLLARYNCPLSFIVANKLALIFHCICKNHN